MTDGVNVGVRDASRSTLQSAANSLEGLLLECTRKRMLETYGVTEIVSLDEILMTTEVMSAVGGNLTSYVSAGFDPLHALAQSYFDMGIGREHPIGFFIELGRRAGYLTPWSNNGRGGKLTKRYSATPEFLETLVDSTIEPDDPLEFGEFLDALRDQYGVIVGQQSDEEYVRRNNLRPSQFGAPTAVNEEDLRVNLEVMRSQLVEAGLARQYADGRTIVTGSVN